MPFSVLSAPVSSLAYADWICKRGSNTEPPGNLPGGSVIPLRAVAGQSGEDCQSIIPPVARVNPVWGWVHMHTEGIAEAAADDVGDAVGVVHHRDPVRGLTVSNEEMVCRGIDDARTSSVLSSIA